MNRFCKRASLALITGGIAGGLCAQNNSTFMTLDEIFSRAELVNRALRISDLAEKEAKQGVKVAKNAQLPEVSASLSFSYLGDANIWDRDFKNGFTAEMPHLGNNFALEASQVVYAGGAISAGIEMAKLQQQLAKLDKERQRQDIRMLLAGNYLELFKLKNQEKVYLQNIAQTQRLINEINAKHSQGVALKNDVTRYELQKKSLELAVTQLRNSQEIINHQLCIALNFPEGTVICVDTTMTNRLPQLTAEHEYQHDAEVFSPILKQSGIGVEMSKQQERLAQAERIPSVALFAGDKFDGPITVEVPTLDKNLNYWYVGIGVKYNISSIFKSNKKVRLSRLATLRNEENRQLAQDNLRTGVKDAYIHYEEAFTIYDTQLKSLELALQNYSVVNNRYLNDLALITDMLDASNSKLNAEIQVVNAQINILFNYYKLQRITGKL